MTSSVSWSMVDVLSPIWERLLDQSSLDAGDNFFSLGGDPALAVKMFTEIAKVTGRELPPTVIYQAPTISALASLLEQPGPLLSPPLVELKPGTEPPIFIAHGIGGTVMELFELVNHIDIPNAIYGTQAIGIDGTSSPLETIEDMAEVFLKAIKKVQIHGPYLLVGHSLGGLVMLELAQRLSGKGDQVALLAMMDSYPHASRSSIGQRARLFCSQAVRRASVALHLNGAICRSSRCQGWTGIYRAPEGASFAPAMRRVRNKANLALKRYQPRFYDGSIKFIRAEVASSFPTNPIPVWAHLAAEFEVETVPGDHLGMLTTHFSTSAKTLSRHLRSVLCLR
jgi:thioesterase domain-containing protein